MFLHRIFVTALAFGCLVGIADAARTPVARKGELVTQLSQRGLHERYSVKTSRTKATHSITARGKTRAEATRLRNAMTKDLKAETYGAKLGVKPTVKVKNQRVQKDYTGLYSAGAVLTVKVNKSNNRVMNKLEKVAEKVEAKHDGTIRVNNYNRDKAQIYTNVSAIPTENDKLEATAKATIKMIKRGKKFTGMVAPAFAGGGVKGKPGRITNVNLESWGGWYGNGGEYTTYGSFTQEVK